MRSGYVAKVKGYFKGKSKPVSIRDLENALPEIHRANIASALNYFIRIGYLTREIGNINDRMNPHRNVWLYKRNKNYKKGLVIPLIKKVPLSELSKPKAD
jgi:hypothetical protein